MTITRLDNGTYDVGEGLIVPSVTTVLQILSPYQASGYISEAAQQAMERGREVHDTIANILHGRRPSDMDWRVRPFVEAWLRFRDEMGFEACDWIEGGSVFDWKTCAAFGITKAMGPQLAGYKPGLNETHPRTRFYEIPVYSRKYGFAGTADATGRMTRAKSRRRGERHIVMLRGDGLYRLATMKDPRDFNTLISCKNVWTVINE